MTFVINDDSIGARQPRIQVTITENPDGTLTFDIVQLAARRSLPRRSARLLLRCRRRGAASEPSSVSDAGGARLTDFEQRNDGVRSLGHGADMRGLLGTGNTAADPNNNRGYDVGLEIGTGWRGRHGDDVRAFHFTLSSESPAHARRFRECRFRRARCRRSAGTATATGRSTRSGSAARSSSRTASIRSTPPMTPPARSRRARPQAGNVLGNDIGPGTKVLTGVSYKGTTVPVSTAPRPIVIVADRQRRKRDRRDGGDLRGRRLHHRCHAGRQRLPPVSRSISTSLTRSADRSRNQWLARRDGDAHEAHLTGAVAWASAARRRSSTQPGVTPHRAGGSADLATSGFGVADDSARSDGHADGGRGVLTLGMYGGAHVRAKATAPATRR